MNTASSPNTASPPKAVSRLFRRPFAEIMLLAAVILVAVLASHCASSEESAGRPDAAVGEPGLPGESASGQWSPGFSEDITLISLSGFDECGALLDYLQGEALELVGPYGLEEPRVSRDEAFAASAATWAEEWDASSQRSSSASDDAEMANFSAFAAPATTAAQSRAPAPAAAPSLAEGADYSGTNVQVEGVDEADIVKTDGRSIIGISSSGELWIADVTRSVPRLRGRLTLRDGDFLELYLDGSRVFVIGNSSVGLNPPGSGGIYFSRTQGDIEIDEHGDAIGEAVPPLEFEDAVVITEVDISDLDNPRVMRHLRVEGRYVSSRLADGYARVVVSSPAEKLGFVRPSSQSNLSEASAERFNQLLIRESTLDQWLPNYNLHAANGETISSGQLLDCDKVYAPSMFSGFNQVSVLSFATGKSLRLRDAASTLADGEMVYASPTNLYVSQVMDDFGAGRRDAGTVVHKFSLSASGSADYEASGAVVGSPLSQYAFHEYDGRLFVSTTSGEWSESESFVTVLEDDGRALKQVGKVGNLGRGEDIYAVRYIGDKAYVVTFRQTDPLYVIDLSDPTAPTTEGELKITGYSAYLHPVGENLLLGVGSEATSWGQVTGAKVSLFDVSDPADPRTLDTLVVDDASSEVEWDARAFLWWAPKRLAVVPISDWNSSGALALRVKTDTKSAEIEQIARITHETRGSRTREILRSIVIRDDLWTLSRSHLQANDLDTLDRRAWLDIPN